MSKRILINATPAGEVWATFVENGTLEELFVEPSRKLKVEKQKFNETIRRRYTPELGI